MIYSLKLFKERIKTTCSIYENILTSQKWRMTYSILTFSVCQEISWIFFVVYDEYNFHFLPQEKFSIKRRENNNMLLMFIAFFSHLLKCYLMLMPSTYVTYYCQILIIFFPWSDKYTHNEVFNIQPNTFSDNKNWKAVIIVQKTISSAERYLHPKISFFVN